MLESLCQVFCIIHNSHGYLKLGTMFSQFDSSSMECQNHGPWHLGISDQACGNAGGRYICPPEFVRQT